MNADEPEKTQPAESTDAEPKPGSRRRVLITIAIVVALAFTAAVIALFFGGNSGGESESTDEVAFFDGVLTTIREDQITLRTDDGTNYTLKIAEADRGQFDFVHLRQHSAVNLKTRAFWEEREDGTYLVKAEDAPGTTFPSTVGTVDGSPQ